MVSESQERTLGAGGKLVRPKTRVPLSVVAR